MTKKLILIGGGGHCKSCIDVIEQSELFEIVGILDKSEFIGQKVLGYDIIGSDEKIEELVKAGYEFLITVGQIRSSQNRKKIFKKLQTSNASLATIISPRAYVSKHAFIEKGSVVMHDALVNANVRIGRNCIINTKALLEHDVVVEDHCHISTAAVLNGGMVVKEGTFFGSNAVSKENVKTVNDDFVKAGSVFLG